MVTRKIPKEEQRAIFDYVRSDAGKIIEYHEEKEHKNRKREILVFVSTIVGAVASVIAAITGIIALLH